MKSYIELGSSTALNIGDKRTVTPKEGEIKRNREIDV